MPGGRDLLTGLLDREAALVQLARWQTPRDGGQPLPIHAMLIGLKRFSAVNLAYGTASGDLALAEVAMRIDAFAAEEFGADRLVARLGGGMFLLAAPGGLSGERWQWLAEELALAISRPIVFAAGPEAVRLWSRMALLRAAPQEDPRQMLNRLSEALDSGRHNPGSRFCWVDGTRSLPMHTPQQLEADLLEALERDEVQVWFQPQFSCPGNALCGAEALARWQHPALGSIGAAALFAIAERAEQTGPLSRRVMRAALLEAGRWPTSLRLSLNATAADLSARDFPAWLEGAAHAAGFPPERLTLEITEQALLCDLERSAQLLQPLAQLGVRIVLDDFGAGFCNFRYLKVLPLAGLKLDRAMLEGVVEDARDLAVLRAILAMARALGLEVVAEGIERADQLAVAEREGCAAWQGFHGASPMRAASFARLAA